MRLELEAEEGRLQSVQYSLRKCVRGRSSAAYLGSAALRLLHDAAASLSRGWRPPRPAPPGTGCCSSYSGPAPSLPCMAQEARVPDSEYPNYGPRGRPARLHRAGALGQSAGERVLWPRGVRERPGSGSAQRWQGPIPALEHDAGPALTSIQVWPPPGSLQLPGTHGQRLKSRSTRPPDLRFLAPLRRLTPDPGCDWSSSGRGGAEV